MTRKGIPLRAHALVTEDPPGTFRFSVPWSLFTATIEAASLDDAHRDFGAIYVDVVSKDQAERDALADYLKAHGI